jgi:hypothetical protein
MVQGEIACVKSEGTWQTLPVFYPPVGANLSPGQKASAAQPAEAASLSASSIHRIRSPGASTAVTQLPVFAK